MATYVDPSGNVWTYTGATITAWAIGTGSYNVTIPSSNGAGQTFTSFGTIFSPSLVHKDIISCIIPDTISSIAFRAFYGCHLLTTVVIGNGVTTIDNYAFYGCTSLTAVTFGSEVTLIGESAFQNCTAMTSITIGDSVLTIGDAAFQGCTSLASLDLGMGVIEIGNTSFYGCVTLTSIVIPDNVTYIGNNTFQSCTNLTNVTIGDGVTTIGISAFYGCSSISAVTIGSGITSIGEQAFSLCIALTSISFLGENVPTFGINWISDTNTSLLGHAYAASDFPLPGSIMSLLMMGDVIPGVSRAPGGFLATPGTNEISFIWDYPLSDGGSSITLYKIYRASKTSTSFTQQGTSVSLEFTDSSLDNNSVYKYYVTATNEYGDGQESTIIYGYVSTSPAPPALKSAIASSTTTTITWVAPTDNRGGAITGYNVYYANSTTTLTKFGDTLGSDTLTCDVTGLQANIGYIFAVTALNAYGESNISNTMITNYTWVPIPLQSAESSGYSLLTFSKLPTSQVDKAILVIPVDTAEYNEIFTIQVHKILSAWNPESTTWNTFAENISPVVSASSTALPGWLHIDITTIVNEWISSPNTNYGLCLTAADEPDNGISFASSYNYKSTYGGSGTTRRINQPLLHIIYDYPYPDINTWGHEPYLYDMNVTNISVGTEVWGAYNSNNGFMDWVNSNYGIFKIDNDGFKAFLDTFAEDVLRIEYTDSLYILNFGYQDPETSTRTCYIARGTECTGDYFDSIIFTSSLITNYNYYSYASSVFSTVDDENIIHFYLAPYNTYGNIYHIWGSRDTWYEEIAWVSPRLYNGTPRYSMVAADRGSHTPLFAYTYYLASYGDSPTTYILEKINGVWIDTLIDSPLSIGIVPAPLDLTNIAYLVPLYMYSDNDGTIHFVYRIYIGDDVFASTWIYIKLKDGMVIDSKNMQNVIGAAKDIDGRMMFFYIGGGYDHYLTTPGTTLYCRKVVTFDPDQYRE